MRTADSVDKESQWSPRAPGTSNHFFIWTLKVKGDENFLKDHVDLDLRVEDWTFFWVLLCGLNVEYPSWSDAWGSQDSKTQDLD